MFKRAVIGVALAVSLAAGGAQAAETVVTVKIDGVEVRVPLPEGMCEATGRFADAAQQAAALDTMNDTIASAFDCDLQSGKSTTVRYAILKRPRSNRGQSMERTALMSEYRANPGGFQRGLNAGANSDEVKDMLDPVMPSETEIATGLKVVGSDDDGIYINGVSRLTNGPAGLTAITMGMTMTAVKGKLLAWTVYGPGDGPELLAEVSRVAKAAGKALVKAN